MAVLVVDSCCNAGLVCLSSHRWSCMSHFSRPPSPIFQGCGFPVAGQKDRGCRVDVLEEELARDDHAELWDSGPAWLSVLACNALFFAGKHPLLLQALKISGGGWLCLQARLRFLSKSIPLGKLDEGLDAAYPLFLRHSMIFLKVTVKTAGNGTVSACAFSSSPARWQFALGCFVHIGLFLIFALCNILVQSHIMKKLRIMQP